MSWNPRRFMTEAKRIRFPTTSYLWLTADAMERIQSHTVRTHSDQFPFSMLIGLHTPLKLDGGEVSMIYMYSGEGVRKTHRRVIDEIAKFAQNNHIPMADLDESIASTESTTYAHELRLHSRDGKMIGRCPMGDGEYTPSKDDVLSDTDIEVVGYVVHAAWTLFNSPTEREISATTASPQRVTVGKKRKARDYDVTVIDINAPLIEREPSGKHRHVEWQFQWGVRPHKRRIWSTDENGNRVRRVIPVKGHRKGPQDKPFKDRKVYQL